MAKATKTTTKVDKKALSALAFDKDTLLACKGFITNSIAKGKSLSLDKVLTAAQSKQLPKVEGNTDGRVHFTDMTILYHKGRKVPFVVAYNIDGSQAANQAPRPTFREDPRIASNIQLNKPFYDLEKSFTEFEIGHMASNNEMGRGLNGMVKAYQTFHYINSVPQAERLNTGIWKGLESYVIKEAARVSGNTRICVFTGPVLKSNDPAYVNDTSFKMPLLFFKVIVFAMKGKLYSTAFMMSHEKKMLEDKLLVIPAAKKVRGAAPKEEVFFTTFPYKTVFQVNLSLLEKETGLNFSWPDVTPLKVPENKRMVEKIKGVKDATEAKKIVQELAAAAKTRAVPVYKSKTNDTVSEKDIASGAYFLNIELPK
jgi:DNA/RNA endonuclease G (NUC1)